MKGGVLLGSRDGDNDPTETARDGSRSALVRVLEPPGAWELLRVWLALGVQSFGGGTATLVLIRRAIVEQRPWIPAEEFTRLWAICHLAPGINLLALTVLLGWRLGGATGVGVSLAGLLLRA